MDACCTLVNTLTTEQSDRARVSASLHHLGIEHYTGIHVLVAAGVHGSAFALYRPQLEAYVRGAWYHLCAEEVEIERFLKGNEPPKYGRLVADLEKHGAYDGGSLSSMKSNVWANLNDFTHGGAIQVKARNSGDEIAQNFKPEHVAGLLTSAATTALLCGVGIAAVCSQDALAVRLRDAYRACYQEAA